MRRMLEVMAVLMMVWLPVTAAEGQAGPTVTVRLEVSGGAAYRKQPLRLDLVFSNAAEPPLELEPAAFEPGAFTIVDERGKPAPPSAVPESAARPEPLHVEGYGTTRRTVDLSPWYPKLASKRNATWQITWSHAGLTAGPLRVRVISPYDPAKDTTAVVRTSIGSMTWTFLPGSAPKHVKRFVDLARQGFYDGLTIFRVIPGIQAEGGDPSGDGTGGWDRLEAPELDHSLAMGPGLVGASRRETSMTSDCMFFITLGQPDFMKGLQTFYARVTDGQEVLAILQRQESRGATALPDAYMLVQPVSIVTIEIR